MFFTTRTRKLYGGISHRRPPYTFGPIDIEFLVVGGGGGGGGVGGAGGGAGGFRTGTTRIAFLGQIAVVIGGPGGGAATGTASSVDYGTLFSAAGGGGAAVYSERAGLNGGCGGGGHMQHNAHTISRMNGVGNTPATSPSQGYDGAYGQN